MLDLKSRVESSPRAFLAAPFRKLDIMAGKLTNWLSMRPVLRRAPVGEAEGKAFKSVASGLEGARAHTAARSIGLAQGALEDAIVYRQRACAIRSFDL